MAMLSSLVAINIDFSPGLACLSFCWFALNSKPVSQNRQGGSLWQPQALHMRDKEHGHQQLGRQTFLTLTFLERYHYILVQDFPLPTEP